MKIFIGGMVLKDQIEQILKEKLPEAELTIGSDLDGAMAMSGQTHDYYLGACMTGGGGALAMCISLLGSEKTLIIAGVTGKKSVAEIKDAIEVGKVAFGMQMSDVEYGVNAFIEAIK